MQQHYKHSVPPGGSTETRPNLTFRFVITHSHPCLISTVRKDDEDNEDEDAGGGGGSKKEVVIMVAMQR